MSLKSIIQLDIKIGSVKASGSARDSLGLVVLFQKAFDEICANTLAIDFREQLRPITDDIKNNLTKDKRNEVPEFNLRGLMPDGYGVDYDTKIKQVEKGIDHSVDGDLLASLGVVLVNMQKISKGYMVEYDVGYNANQEGAKFEAGEPSAEFKRFKPDGSLSPYPLVEQAWAKHGKQATNMLLFKALLNFEALWIGN